jgi:hypothetical protein
VPEGYERRLRLAAMWGRMASCGRLAIGLWLAAAVQMTGRRVANPPQDAILPHKSNRSAFVCHTPGFQFVSK